MQYEHQSVSLLDVMLFDELDELEVTENDVKVEHEVLEVTFVTDADELDEMHDDDIEEGIDENDEMRIADGVEIDDVDELEVEVEMQCFERLEIDDIVGVMIDEVEVLQYGENDEIEVDIIKLHAILEVLVVYIIELLDILKKNNEVLLYDECIDYILQHHQ